MLSKISMLIIDIEIVRNTKKSNDDDRRFFDCRFRDCFVDLIEKMKKKTNVVDEKKRNLLWTYGT